MTDKLRNWWSGLSQRERWLVGVAGVLACGVLIWGLARPAVAAFIDLDSRHRTAIESEGRVKAKVQLIARRPAKRVEKAVDAGALEQDRKRGVEGKSGGVGEDIGGGGKYQ